MQTGGLGSVIGGAGVDPKMPFLCGPVYGRNAQIADVPGPSGERAKSTPKATFLIGLVR